MLETIRDSALERLAERGEPDLIAERHAAYFLALGESLAPAEPYELMVSATATWLEREHDNLCVALDWTSAHGPVETAARLAAVLWPFWNERLDWGEGRGRLPAALAQLDSAAATLHDMTTGARILRSCRSVPDS